MDKKQFKLKLFVESKKIFIWTIFLNCLLVVICYKSFLQVIVLHATLLNSQTQLRGLQDRTKQSLLQIKEVFAQQNETLEFGMQLLQQKVNSNQVLNNLAMFSEKNSIRLLVVKPLETNRVNNLRALAFEVKGSGTYFLLIDWLFLLKKLNGIVLFDSLIINPLAKNSSDVQFDLVFYVLTL